MIAYHRKRALLLICLLLSGGIFYYAARFIGVPAHPGFEMSLLQQPHQPLPMLMVGVALLVGTLLSTAIVGRVRAEAGFFAATLGMGVLSALGGPMRDVLFAAGTPAIYLVLAIELALLFVILCIAWSAITLLRTPGLVALEEGEEDESTNQRLLALAASAVAMTLLMLILCRSDDKFQAMASTFIAALVGTMGAHWLFPTRPSIWYWMAPLAVGLLGYLWAWQMPSPDFAIGVIDHPLARPLPIDYASFGASGSILGYWLSRRSAAAAAPESQPAAA
jgi:hypothetical protein